MPSGDSGINKPFDRIFKAFADEEPELLLRLLGFIPNEATADIQPLRPETAPAVVMPDFVVMVRTEPGERFLFHAEFQSSYHSTVPRQMARYGGSLAWQYQMPVESALILLRPQGTPAEVPIVGHYDIGSTRTTHPFQVIRLWEVDPTAILETDNPKLLPWAVAMKLSDEQMRRIASAIARRADDETFARFLLLGGLRYDRDELGEMLGGRRMGLLDAIREGSSLFTEERAEGRAEGQAEGQRQGQADEARKLLRIGLRAKFPSLEHIPEIDRISGIERLEALCELLFTAPDPAAMREAILAAVKPN